jgi:hypothetical protein
MVKLVTSQAYLAPPVADPVSAITTNVFACWQGLDGCGE